MWLPARGAPLSSTNMARFARMFLLPRTGLGHVIEVNGEDWKFDPSGRLLDRPDPDTYDPCWCGSGERFRFCHRDRHRQPRVSNPEFLRGWEDAYDSELCLHPTAPDGCSETIVRAHSVQRMGGGLKAIARAGHVYAFKHHPSFFQKNDLRIVKPDLVGTRKVSTFRGFCSTHDASLFRVAEDQAFKPTQEQLHLLNFRVVARRVYGMQCALRHAKVMVGYDRGLPPQLQREWFAVHHRYVVNNAEALANVTALKSHYDPQVIARSFGDTNGFMVHFSGIPDFQCAEIVPLTFDFSGRRLKEPSHPAHLCAYTVAVPGGWVFVFSWAGRNIEAEKLCASLLEQPDSEKGPAILRYALEHTDNIFFAPRWWDALSVSHQTLMAQALTSPLHPHYLRDPHTLMTRVVPPLSAQYLHVRSIGPWAAAP